TGTGTGKENPACRALGTKRGRGTAQQAGGFQKSLKAKCIRHGERRPFRCDADSVEGTALSEPALIRRVQGSCQHDLAAHIAFVFIGLRLPSSSRRSTRRGRRGRVL